VKRALTTLLDLTTDRLWLCMENTAGAGGTIGRDVAELAAICDRLGGHRRLGVCIDSCHWWATGVDVSDAESLDVAVADVDAQLGLERLRCLHVNDAAIALGANRDRHEVVARGVIGNGLATFLGHPAFRELPAVLETWPKGGLTTKDVDELRRLHRLGKRRWVRRSAPG
jgi:deoxyribonuclease-4